MYCLYNLLLHFDNLFFRSAERAPIINITSLFGTTSMNKLVKFSWKFNLGMDINIWEKNCPVIAENNNTEIDNYVYGFVISRNPMCAAWKWVDKMCLRLFQLKLSDGGSFDKSPLFITILRLIVNKRSIHGLEVGRR